MPHRSRRHGGGLSFFLTLILILGFSGGAYYWFSSGRKPVSPAAEPPRPHTGFFQGFMEFYCMDCHNAEAFYDDDRFEQLLADPSDSTHRVLLEEIALRVADHTMPPMENENTPLPNEQERQRLVDYIRQLTATSEASSAEKPEKQSVQQTMSENPASAPLRTEEPEAEIIRFNLNPQIPAFINRYCLSCHQGETAKSDRDFAAFLADPNRMDQLHVLEEVLDQLNLGAMPPQRQGVDQPGDTERRHIVDQITALLDSISDSKRASSTVLRRMTRTEYNNTMRDLLGVHPESSDATTDFTTEQTLHGFANVGSEQMISDYQLQLYMQAARTYLDQALVFNTPKPKTRRWTFTPADFNGSDHFVGVSYRVYAKDKSYIDLGDGEPMPQEPVYPRKFSRTGVPSDGYYRIRVKAEGVGRNNPYDDSLFKCDLSMPIKMGLWHVPDQRYLRSGVTDKRVLMETYDLPDEETGEFEALVWLPKGSGLFVNWMNGEGYGKGLVSRIHRKHHPDTRILNKADIARMRAQGREIPEHELNEDEPHILDVYEGPRVRLYGMTVEGPINETWPPLSHRSLVGDVTDPARVDLERTFRVFATKAFRRPVDPEEISHYVAFVKKRIQSGTPADEAIKLGLTAVLCSPRFLYLAEGNPETEALLDQYELASRLSYMIWSSAPDIELLRYAHKGQLRNLALLRKQTERLLEDPRSAAFIENFTRAWLRLDKIGTMPPSVKQYPTYYYHRLEDAMIRETELFFEEVLRKNKPITELFLADYTFLNDGLARHYGIKNVYGEHFRRVSLPNRTRRRGILGHASILTASANGVDTTPVTRGVWVLESLLGTPPTPPPPDVPPIEPDTRGARTVRDQIEMHRTIPACADCHQDIDPWGFPLEFYDPIGGLRTHYAGYGDNDRIIPGAGAQIDGSARLPSGERIKDEEDLNRILVRKRDQLAKCLVEKLLIYSTGREMTYRDQPEIQAIVRKAAQDSYKMQDLMFAVITSEIFQQR